MVTAIFQFCMSGQVARRKMGARSLRSKNLDAGRHLSRPKPVNLAALRVGQCDRSHLWRSRPSQSLCQLFELVTALKSPRQVAFNSPYCGQLYTKAEVKANPPVPAPHATNWSRKGGFQPRRRAEGSTSPKLPAFARLAVGSSSFFHARSRAAA